MLVARQIYSVIVIVFIAATVPIHADIEVKWTTTFEPNNLTLHMHDSRVVDLRLAEFSDLPDLIAANATIRIVSDNNILEVNRQIPISEVKNGQWSGPFNVSATFLGRAQVYVHIEHKGNVSQSTESLPVVIIREERLIDTLFTISVASLVSILYINFGAALDLQKVRAAFVRPIGPCLALFCHFLVLPVVCAVFGGLSWKISSKIVIIIFYSGKLCVGPTSFPGQC